MDHIQIALNYKLGSKSCNNWQRSQNKNSFLFQALLPRLKNYPICRKLKNYMVKAMQTLTPSSNKLHPHQWIYLIFCQHKITSQIMQNIDKAVQKEWRCLHKQQTTPNWLVRSINCRQKLQVCKIHYNNICNLNHYRRTPKSLQLHHQSNRSVLLYRIRPNGRNQLHLHRNNKQY